jgi:hypothetical protein
MASGMIQAMDAETRQGIAVPTQHELNKCSAQFQLDWRLVDEVLYDLCRTHPDHADRQSVTAKLAIVGRVYSAGLERRVTPPTGQQAITVIADYVLDHGSRVDQIIRALDSVCDPLDASSMGMIVEQHGLLTMLLQERATDGKAPRSFASKYLHFHRHFVPIYDEYARRKLSRLVRWDRSYIPFAMPAHGDREYWDYCLRFFRLYEACRTAGLQVTVKTLDAYLWSVGGLDTPSAIG